MRRSGKKKRAGNRKASLLAVPHVGAIDANELIPGPKLRAKIGIQCSDAVALAP
jgi:hypothetical protein